MDSRLALVRATHLNDYISVLRKIGAPVDRDIARSKLPGHLEETPDLYISLPVALEWLAKTGRDVQPMELGLLAARQTSLASLHASQQTAIMTAQTAMMRLEALAALSRYEDTALRMALRREAGDVRVICTMAGLGGHPFLCFAEWLNLQAVVSVVRSVMGSTWSPAEMCFASPFRPSDMVRAAFPHTRIRVGQPQTSVLFESTCLARRTEAAQPLARAEDALRDRPDDWEFITLLRKVLQPYLADRRPSVAFAAELAGISTRTLQRRLTQCGSSYSQILQDARFELACARLDDPGLKIIDVAMMAGYDSPQHFTRAFRRYSGATPTVYRQQSSGGSAPHPAATADH